MKRNVLRALSLIVPLSAAVPFIAQALTLPSDSVALTQDVLCEDSQEHESGQYLFVSCGGFF